MQLPEDDGQYLHEKELRFELLLDGNQALLLLPEYAIDAAKYDREFTTIMVRLPSQYPNAKLDMFYADPPLKLNNGAFPPQADHFENHGGRRWQRFSRHLPQWRVGLDGLPTLLTFIHKELRNGA